ncbi:hypothetical protein [Actinoplanes friuliensis]|uniref:Uncharacterized protein n=1 Tax=Actinoplanes friuliensis DSM 7358 TaxID=1246995 RepID=U5W7I1_9ACTN|nr:hypothetical protein [Actinoplanes friuliensis]AGZ43911.1 hypothetical protein AFR_28250 [Actinoplanes friuliensis DSM 7358]
MTPPAYRDPLAVAIGNASLLGVGYFMLRRRRLAICTGMVTLILLLLLAGISRTRWLEIVVLSWWALMIVHGFFLARRGGAEEQWGRLIATARGNGAGRQRVTALALTVPVLVAFGLLRFEASRISETVADARRSGDCGEATAALDRVWLGLRVADAPSTLRGEKTVEACRRLRFAGDKLAEGLTGVTNDLDSGFDTLTSVLTELPGHERMVDTVLDGFLAGLPTPNPCLTLTITDWLTERPPSNNALDRSTAAVTRTAPAALVGCGDKKMSARDWQAARGNYQQLLKSYPGDALAGRARQGISKATVELELKTVRERLQGSDPEYCGKPAKYSAAPPYRKGTNRALFYGNDEYTDKLPGGWRAPDVTKAVLIVCAGETKFGKSVQSCPYENKKMPRFPTYVSFHKIAIPVKAYELRTGRLVANRTVQINGTSCPRILRYTTYLTDFGPPSQVYVKTTTAKVRSVFAPMIVRR